MGRGIMMRWACAVAGVAMVVSGCNCPGTNPPVDCTDTTVTFVTPTADQTVDSPFEVTFDVKTSTGSPFDINAATLSVGGGSFTGTVSGNRATFTGVTATAGAQTLTASIAQGSCSKTYAPQSITVRDACSTPAVTAVSFPQDLAPLGVLNRAELPDGTNLQVQVTATCVSDVQVRIMRGTTVVGPLTSFTNGVATITTTLPDSDNARYDLFAELVRNGSPVNTATGNPAASASIQVSRGLPTCSVTTTGTFGPSDDADPIAAGFQMRVNGTMAVTSTGTLAVTGQTPKAVTPSMTGDVSADFTLATSGLYMATLVCTDANGNTNTSTGSFTVDFTPPTVTIVSPANVDGGATMVVTQSPLQVQVSTDAPDGSTAILTSTGGGQGSNGTVMNGMVTLPASFGADGSYVITIQITDPAGNVGSATLAITVTLDGCGAIFTRPGACPALLTQSQLVSGAYSFQTTSKPACANQPAALFRADVLADGGFTASVPAGTTNLTAAGLAAFAPLTLASGDYVLAAQVANIGVDAGISSAICRVTVDLDGPAITNPVVPTGSTYAALTAAQDTQSGTPGVQRTLTFSARVPVGGRVDVCTTQAVNPVTMTPRPTSAECGAGWYVLQQGVTSPSSAFTFPDGSYDIKIVVVGGGLAVPPSSPPVSLLVDGVRPCVNGLSRRLPQDANADGRLNIAELAGGQPRLEFALGCGDSSPATLDTTAAVVVRDITGGVAGAVRPSSSAFASGVYTVTLTGAYATEVDLNLFVELTDLAGNKNLIAATNDPSSYQLRVDPVAPVCNITSPSASQTLLGIAQVPAGNFDVIVATSADVGTNGVNVTFTGQAARSLTPMLSQAQSTYALTLDNTYTIGAVCTDLSGNPSTATTRTTRVDLVPPTCNITTPADMSASSVNDVSTTVAVTGVADGDTVVIASSVPGILNNQLIVAGGSATRLVRYANGAQTVTASISDAAGNPCVAPVGGTRQIQLTVNSTSCNLDFAVAGAVITNANGSWVNRLSAANPSGTSPATVTIGALTSDCGAGRNVYLYQGPPVTTPASAPQVTIADGSVNFPGTSVSEGQQWTVTINNGAGVLTHRSFLVSFVAPSIASIGLQRSAAVATIVPVAVNAGMVFGAASGNRRVESAVATDMVFGDLDGATADAQFQLTLTGVDGARVGTMNAALDVLEGSTALMPTVSVTSASFNPSLPRMKLGHRLDETTTSLVIRVTSPAGNVFTSTHVAEVDVIAPSPPSITQNLTAARAATVGLAWSPVFDDAANAASGGLTGGTPVAGYDVRWTTSSVPSNNAMAAEADYFGSSSNPDGITAWSASAINKSLTLPPLNTYFIAVRARDEVGNYSTFAAPVAITNMWTELTLTVASAPLDFGHTILASNSVAGTSANDVVISAPSRGNVGSVYIFQGGPSFASQTTCGTGCQELTPPDGVGAFFGSDVSVAGNVADDATDATTTGISDVLIGQRSFSTTGRAFIFLGTTGATLTKTIEIRGDASNVIGWTSTIIKDLDGDGLDEVALPAYLYGGGRGRVYVFKGRSFASWQAAFVAGQQYVAITSADWVIEGEYLYAATPANSSNGFGVNRLGVASLPGVTGRLRTDGGIMPELVVTIPRGNVSRAAIYGGDQIVASSIGAPLGGFDGGIQVLSQTPIASNSVVQGFGASISARGPVQRLDLVDLYVGYPSESRVYRYSNWGSGGVVGGAATEYIQGASSFGANITSSDLNGDGRPDLIVGEGLVAGNGLWVLYQRAGAFDQPVGGVNIRFNVSQIRPVRTGALTNSMPNRFIAVGDIGSGAPALLTADSALGSVRVWE